MVVLSAPVAGPTDPGRETKYESRDRVGIISNAGSKRDQAVQLTGYLGANRGVIPRERICHFCRGGSGRAVLGDDCIWKVPRQPFTTLCCCVRMGQHLTHVVELGAIPCKQQELHREHDLADDPEWFPVSQIVQCRGDRAFHRILDRHQSSGNVAVTDCLEGQPNGGVRRGLVRQRRQRQQRLVREGSDRSVVAIVGRRDCEHRLRLSLPGAEI